MRLKLWKHLFLSLLLPGGLALAITLYAIVNVGKDWGRAWRLMGLPMPLIF